jgi:anti-anti-sigma regulatory factor
MGETPDTRRIERNGEYDLPQREQAASPFEALRPDGPAVIDLTKVTYVDSVFLRELVKLRRRFGEHSITLIGASDSVMFILRQVGLISSSR